jgi:electron transfer flavoprotein alpha subunit
MKDNNDVWVLLETEDKKIKNISLSLIDEGKRLSEQLGGKLCGIMFSRRFEKVDEVVGIHGVDQLYVFHHGTANFYNPIVYGELLTRVVLRNRPCLFLAAATSYGSDLMPRVAAKLRAPLVTHCVEIRIKDNIEFVKPVQRGRLHATIISKIAGTQMATIDPKALNPSREKSQSKTAKVTEIVEETGDEQGPIQRVGFLKADHNTIDISEAEIIVAVGRGIGSVDRFELIKAFANRIGAALGGTRPVIDAGLLPFERQIGQTGKMVSPKIIILCGISGAMEFTKGIENAETRIAINIDSQAPIFRSVDLGIVGDLNVTISKILTHIDEESKLKETG